MTRPLGRLLLLGALTLFWGGNWPALKLAIREIDPWTFRTLCLVLGGAALLALVRAGGQSLAVPRRERGPLCLVTFFNITAWHLLSAYGLTRIPAGRGAIIAYTMPIWTVVLGWLLLGERLTGAKAVALVLGTAGLVVLVARDVRALWAAPAGVLLMLAAAIVWALGTVLIKAFRWTVPTATLTGWQLVLGGVPIALGALVRLGWGPDDGGLHGLTRLNPGALAGAAYATFVGVTFCHWAWFKLVGALPAAVAAIGVLGIPVVGVFSSALVIGEPVGAAELAALALVVSGLAVLLGGPAQRGGALTAPREPAQYPAREAASEFAGRTRRCGGTLRREQCAMSKTGRDWDEEVTRREADLIAQRRDFHRHPELSHQERRTAEVIAERLHAAKLEVRTGVAGTGVVGLLRGDRPGRTVAWRADIDALPLTETLQAPFASGTPGVMHACGHDGHTAIALTLADILAARRAAVPGTAVFLFQPAEEVLGGARPMIEAGVLDDPRVDEVYGLHLTTLHRVGRAQVRSGPLMASADAFTVEVRGTGGHGAMPHLSIDPITAAANILLGMQSLVSREVPAHDSAVLTVGQIVSGTKGNILPDRAVMRGTIRTFEPGIREHLVSRLRAFVGHIAAAYRAEAEMRLEGGSCPAVVNHAEPAELVRRCLVEELGGEAVTEGRLVMASDDMSLFLRERPGCYFRVGIAPAAGPARPHHAPEFEMDEGGLAVGLRTGLRVMRAALAR